MSSASAGLRQVVRRAEAHRVDRGGDAAVAGEHDDLGRGVDAARSSRTSSRPERPGIRRSTTASSGDSRRASATAVVVVAGGAHVVAAIANARARRSRKTSSSSTIRIDGAVGRPRRAASSAYRLGARRLGSRAPAAPCARRGRRSSREAARAPSVPRPGVGRRARGCRRAARPRRAPGTGRGPCPRPGALGGEERLADARQHLGAACRRRDRAPRCASARLALRDRELAPPRRAATPRCAFFEHAAQRLRDRARRHVERRDRAGVVDRRRASARAIRQPARGAVDQLARRAVRPRSPRRRPAPASAAMCSRIVAAALDLLADEPRVVDGLPQSRGPRAAGARAPWRPPRSSTAASTARAPRRPPASPATPAAPGARPARARRGELARRARRARASRAGGSRR